MPLYQCTTKRGMLSAEMRSAIAEDITHVHCTLTGAPRHYVHVRFDTYEEGELFTGGKSSDFAFIRGGLRAGRPDAFKAQLLGWLNQVWADRFGAAACEKLLISVSENPASNVMEGGHVMPHPKDDPGAASLNLPHPQDAALVRHA